MPDPNAPSLTAGSLNTVRMPGAPMPALPSQPDLTAIEHEMLTRWNRLGTFEASLKQTEGAPRWTF